MPNRFLPMKKAHLSSLDDDSDPHNYFFRLIKNSILSDSKNTKVYLGNSDRWTQLMA